MEKPFQSNHLSALNSTLSKTHFSDHTNWLKVLPEDISKLPFISAYLFLLKVHQYYPTFWSTNCGKGATGNQNHYSTQYEQYCFVSRCRILSTHLPYIMRNYHWRWKVSFWFYIWGLTNKLKGRLSPGKFKLFRLKYFSLSYVWRYMYALNSLSQLVSNRFTYFHKDITDNSLNCAKLSCIWLHSNSVANFLPTLVCHKNLMHNEYICAQHHSHGKRLASVDLTDEVCMYH